MFKYINDNRKALKELIDWFKNLSIKYKILIIVLILVALLYCGARDGIFDNDKIILPVALEPVGVDTTKTKVKEQGKRNEDKGQKKENVKDSIIELPKPIEEIISEEFGSSHEQFHKDNAIKEATQNAYQSLHNRIPKFSMDTLQEYAKVETTEIKKDEYSGTWSATVKISISNKYRRN